MNLLPRPRHVDLSGATVGGQRVAPAVARDPTLPADGYELSINGDGRVAIAAADDAGEFYARATLDQLDALGDRPVGVIRDWPDLAVRGVMLDCSRDKVPTLPTLFDLIDRLASWKINHVELYLEHTFAYADHEIVWRDASPFTATEIAELDEFCRARHVELTPNQNCLGHMRRWLGHDRYRDLALSPPPGMPARPVPTTIDPTNPASLAFVRGLLTELLEAFSSRRVHVGLDEPWELGDERFDDYLHWLRALRDLPELADREMLVWGDILAGHTERVRQIPDGVTTCEWGYEASHPFAARTATYAEADKPFWVAPGTSAWCTLVGRVTNMVANVASAVDAAAEHGGVGLLTTDWGDLGHLQYLPVSDPGFAYAAAMGWCRDTNRDLDLAAALSVHCYDDPSGQFADALLALGDVHRCVTPQAPNISTLMAPLYWPQLHLGRGFLDGFDIDGLDQVDEIVARAQRAIGAATPRRTDAELLTAELTNAAALVGLIASDERARLGVDGTLPAVAAADRATLAEELRPLIARHRELWLARNRPGGLDDSAAWLEHLATCYETGDTPNNWGAWT